MRWLCLAFLLVAMPAAAAPGLPDWAKQAVGSYAGLVRNNGRLECHHTVFVISGGQLTGHYWIDDPDPFEGDLTDFVETGPGEGRFTWTDRYGRGIEQISFNADFSGFRGLWGIGVPMAANLVNGRRGKSCEAAVSAIPEPLPTG